jgi:hypothetical protein
VVEHFSMHTGQILLLTKMLADKDLRFLRFLDRRPLHTWQEPKSWHCNRPRTSPQVRKATGGAAAQSSSYPFHL